MSRGLRDYKLIVDLSESNTVEITPEIRVVFDVTKSIKGGLNKATIQIYNLSADKRNQLIVDNNDKKSNLKILLQTGYTDIESIFQGTIQEGVSARQGSDIITTLRCLDGGFDFSNSHTSKTVTSNDLSHILDDMPNTKKGSITERKKLIRPRVLFGNSSKIIEESLAKDETYFIDNETLHLIKDDEVVSDKIPVIDSSTGLLNVPTRKEKETSFDCILNPNLNIGGLVKIESSINPNLSGIYKIETIQYRGDIHGSDWSQSVTCVIVENYKVVKSGK